MIKREKCECLIVRVSLTHDWCLCSNTSSLFSDLKFIMPRVRKNVNIMFSNPIWISSSRPNLNFLRLLWRAVPPKCSPAAACCAAPATSTTTPPCVIRYTKEEVSFLSLSIFQSSLRKLVAMNSDWQNECVTLESWPHILKPQLVNLITRPAWAGSRQYDRVQSSSMHLLDFACQGAITIGDIIRALSPLCPLDVSLIRTALADRDI